ncbi:NhaD family Na+:H+ antiporter [Chlamydiifrater phoenicopteri]|uniref:NhaD family Na+:H+ antiporter n=1 Tax=Chlamydiifrater phoenicopteri TaxID=2681469 RepID=UPI001BCC19A3|nr:NhaD family Na+:H+ antiporter [Chlamydiifrater phoenicopteri]
MLGFQLGILFLFGYLAIVFENVVRVSKSAIALVMGGLMWLVCFAHMNQSNEAALAAQLSETAQVIFFLFSAMAIVELIDAHKGFSLISRFCHIKSRAALLWVLIILSFFLSSALDNLTSIIVIVSILKRLVKSREDRLMLGAVCVVAVNAGGAWTPLGDVTTTMLWIHGKVSTWGIIRSLFLPSVVCAVIAGCLALLAMKKQSGIISMDEEKKCRAPGGTLIICLGLFSLLMIPVWKSSMGLPPFLGALMGLGLVWLVSDWLHHPHGDDRNHLRVSHILTKIDISSITFFIGILLSVGALSYAGILTAFSAQLDSLFPRKIVAVVIGLISSVLDNVPLVAATINMYTEPLDDSLWHLIAYTAGTGGSILLVGSAAGVAFMGLEKVDFLWYLRKMSWIALLSYFGGVGAYFFLEKFFCIF